MFMMIVPRCKKCDKLGVYLSPEAKRKTGITWFHVCICPKCLDVLEFSLRGTTDTDFMDKRLIAKMDKKIRKEMKK